MHLFISVWLKFLFVLSPFFVLPVFLSLTDGYGEPQQRKLAIRVTVAVGIVCLVLFLSGSRIFHLLGITLDSFRIGAGALLFLSAIQLAQSGSSVMRTPQESDPAVVPLAVPVIVGPAVAGTVMVMSAECTRWWERVIVLGALGWAIICVGALLYVAAVIQRKLGRDGLAVLAKLSGLILAALAAQIIFTGIRNLMATA
ncbi:MAG: MarC family protein [Kiritimatiellae bacterium]|nr:MarC family protein [Kiritimatiellia bacterium]